MTACDTCDFRLWPCYCIAEITGHAPLCARRHAPEWRALIAARTLDEPGPEPSAARSASDARLARILSDACGVRESACHCLDVPALCHRGGWPRLVTIDQCRACPASDPGTDT